MRRLAGLVIAVAVAAGVAFVSWPRLAVVRQERNNVPAGELVAGRRFGQTFRAPFSGLYRVDVVLATYARTNQGSILFHLDDEVEGPDLAVIEIDAATVQNNASQMFAVEPVAGSSGREYLFYLEAPTAEAGNAITIWKTDYDSYPGGQAYVDRVPVGGDLRFTAYYRSTPGEVWDALADHVHFWHPLLWQMRWVVLAVGVLWVLGIGVLLGELLVERRDSE